MSNKNKLSKENRKKFKKILKKRIESIKERLDKEISGSINQRIEINRNEIKDVGIIICAFDNEKTPFDFVRTEPLFFFKEKNFDVLLFGNKTAIFIEVKETLVPNPVSKIDELKTHSKMVVDNVEINNKIENKKMKIIDYLSGIAKAKIDNKEFVLATQKVNVQLTMSKAKIVGFNFCLWKLVEKENKIFIIPEIIAGDSTSAFYGHKDSGLKKYLSKLSKAGGVYNDTLTFMFSSSIYLKSVAISIPLYKRTQNKFEYQLWCNIFKTDMLNWHETEKKIVYKKYIEYGKKCKFIKCIQNKGDIFSDIHTIVSRHSKTSLLWKDIVSKMVRCSIGEKISDSIPNLEKEIISELLTQEAKKEGTKPLSDYL